MPRSTNLNRYPVEYFQALEHAAKNGQFVVNLGDKNKAESLRLDFYAMRRGIEDSQFQPYIHYVKHLRFLVRDGSLVIQKGDLDAAAALIRSTLGGPGGPPFIPGAEHNAHMEAAQQLLEGEDRIRQLMIDQGIIGPQTESDGRTPDQLITDLLKLKK